jgi:hypothetical protein
LWSRYSSCLLFFIVCSGSNRSGFLLTVTWAPHYGVSSRQEEEQQQVWFFGLSSSSSSWLIYQLLSIFFASGLKS